MRILINAINLNSAGGKTVGRHLLRALDESESHHEIVALVSDVSGLAAEITPRRIELHQVTRTGPRVLWRALDDAWRIRTYCRRFRADVCFSLGDLGPVHLPCPHVVLVHNPWLLYETSGLSNRLRWRERAIYQKAYPARFRRMCKTLAAATVQTPVVAERLLRNFPLSPNQVKVVPSACTIRPFTTHDRTPPPAMAKHAGTLRLLFLAQFYPHKNHHVLPPLLRELKRRKRLQRFHFFLTVRQDHPGCRRVLRELREFGDSVTNLGPLPPDAVRDHLAHSHALFLPTLLETFGLVYLEAMACGTPILTSDLDFGRFMCEDYAHFFSPTEPTHIADTLLTWADTNPECGSRKTQGAEILNRRFFGWDEIAAAYLALLESVAAR